MHRSPATLGNAFKQRVVRCRLGGDDALASCGIDGYDVRHDDLPVSPWWRRFVGPLVVSEGFGTSARKAKNGFMRGKIVSSQPAQRNISHGKASNLKQVNLRL
jgi:hypothetical protein